MKRKSLKLAKLKLNKESVMGLAAKEKVVGAGTLPPAGTCVPECNIFVTRVGCPTAIVLQSCGCSD